MITDPLSVLYDISILAHGQIDVLARTGIYRTAENIAFALAASDRIALEFCACSSLEFNNYAQKYLAKTPQLAHAAFATPPETQTLERHMHDAVFAMSSRFGAMNFWTRVLRKITSMAFPRQSSNLPLFAPESIERAQIYQSPNIPIPAEIRRYPHLSCFLIIYDLIPILYPEYYGALAPKMRAWMEETLRSITPEDWVLCISEATKRDLCAYRADLSPARVIVTPLAASRDFYQVTDAERLRQVRAKYKIPDGPYVLSLSTLEPRKNIDHVIRAFVKLVQEQHLTDLSLVLVGAKGWDSARIFSAIDTSGGIIDRIIVTGYVEDADLPALYSGALTFAYMSFYEGFGLPPLEAMQCGVPVITSNTSSLPEVVGDTGVQLDPRDLDGLCQAIWSLYSDATLRQEQARRSLARAQRFTWEQCAADIIDAYCLAAAEKCGGAKVGAR